MNSKKQTTQANRSRNPRNRLTIAPPLNRDVVYSRPPAQDKQIGGKSKDSSHEDAEMFIAARKSLVRLRSWGHRMDFATDSPRSAVLHYRAAAIVGNVLSQFGAIHFQLDQFAGYLDWVSVSDAYRLLKASVRFIPRITVHSLAVQAVATTLVVSPLQVVIDYDDSSSLSTLTELDQYNQSFLSNPVKEMTIKLEPRVSSAVYAGGITNGYIQEDSDVWLDAGNDDIEHYGLKWGTWPSGGSQTTFQTWDVYVTGWFQFRQPR